MSDMAFEYKLREFTVDEYHRMGEIGLLRPDERVELLDGAIVKMSPIGNDHWRRHARIVEYLIGALGKRALVAGQSSLPLGDLNEPQPDIAVLARECETPRGAAPAPAEIYGLIEISDTSLRKDLGPKLRLYARFGISDYLVVDLNAEVLLHYHEPHELGYSACDRLDADQHFELASLRGIVLQAEAFLEQKSS